MTRWMWTVAYRWRKRKSSSVIFDLYRANVKSTVSNSKLKNSWSFFREHRAMNNSLREKRHQQEDGSSSKKLKVENKSLCRNRWVFLFVCVHLRSLRIATPRQNALRMSTNLSFRSVTHFRLRIKIQCKQAKIPYREVWKQKVRVTKKR